MKIKFKSFVVISLAIFLFNLLQAASSLNIVFNLTEFHFNLNKSSPRLRSIITNTLRFSLSNSPTCADLFYICPQYKSLCFGDTQLNSVPIRQACPLTCGTCSSSLILNIYIYYLLI